MQLPVYEVHFGRWWCVITGGRKRGGWVGVREAGDGPCMR